MNQPKRNLERLRKIKRALKGAKMVVSSFLAIKIFIGPPLGRYVISKISTLFKRCRVTKKKLIKAIYEYIGSKNGLRIEAWKNGLIHQTVWYWVKKFRLFRESFIEL